MEAGSTKPVEVPSSCDGSTTMGCSSDLNRFDDPDDDPVDRLAGCKGEIIPVLCLCESVSSHEVTLGINRLHFIICRDKPPRWIPFEDTSLTNESMKGGLMVIPEKLNFDMLRPFYG